MVADADRDRLTAELDFAAVPEYMAAFPFPHRVRYAVNVEGSTLWIALTVIASGEVAVPVSFGFHPYLTLPGLGPARMAAGDPGGQAGGL